MTIVSLVRGTVIVVALGKDENVVTASEGVFEDGSGTKIDIGVFTGGLIGGGTVEVPDTKLANISNFLAHGRSLVTKPTVTVNPDVFGLNFVALRKSEVGGQELIAVGIAGHDIECKKDE
jgi:hypothetical protein